MNKTDVLKQVCHGRCTRLFKSRIHELTHLNDNGKIIVLMAYNTVKLNRVKFPHFHKLWLAQKGIF